MHAPLMGDQIAARKILEQDKIGKLIKLRAICQFFTCQLFQFQNYRLIIETLKLRKY